MVQWQNGSFSLVLTTDACDWMKNCGCLIIILAEVRKSPELAAGRLD